MNLKAPTCSEIVRVHTGKRDDKVDEREENRLLAEKRRMTMRRRTVMGKGGKEVRSATYLDVLEDQEVKEGHVYKLTAEEVCRSFSTDMREGLSEKLVRERLSANGINEPTVPAVKHWSLAFLAEVSDPLNLFCWVVVLIEIVLFGLERPLNYNYIFMVVAIVLTILISGFMGFKFNRNMEFFVNRLNEMMPVYAKVIRDGQIATVRTTHIVPGDVISLTAGDSVPADIRIVESTNLKVNNHTFTGENRLFSLSADACTLEEPESDQIHCIAYCGCLIEEGNGLGIVVATGSHTLVATLSSQSEFIE